MSRRSVFWVVSTGTQVDSIAPVSSHVVVSFGLFQLHLKQCNCFNWDSTGFNCTCFKSRRSVYRIVSIAVESTVVSTAVSIGTQLGCRSFQSDGLFSTGDGTGQTSTTYYMHDLEDTHAPLYTDHMKYHTTSCNLPSINSH